MSPRFFTADETVEVVFEIQHVNNNTNNIMSKYIIMICYVHIYAFHLLGGYLSISVFLLITLVFYICTLTT